MTKNSQARKIISAAYHGMTDAEISANPAQCMDRAMDAARAGLGLPPSPFRAYTKPDEVKHG
jgi:hypothetical protein